MLGCSSVVRFLKATDSSASNRCFDLLCSCSCILLNSWKQMRTSTYRNRGKSDSLLDNAWICAWFSLNRKTETHAAPNAIQWLMRTVTNTSNGTRYQPLIDVANTRSSSKCRLIFQHIINIDDPGKDQEPETPIIMRPIGPFSSKRKRFVSDHDIAPFKRVRIRNIPVQNSVLPVF